MLAFVAAAAKASERLDALALSHGHYDHFGGMVGFLRANKGRDLWLPAFRRCLEDNPGDLRDWAARIEPELAKWMLEEAVIPEIRNPESPSLPASAR